jgi:hypothetical protein
MGERTFPECKSKGGLAMSIRPSNLGRALSLAVLCAAFSLLSVATTRADDQPIQPPPAIACPAAQAYIVTKLVTVYESFRMQTWFFGIHDSPQLRRSAQSVKRLPCCW